MVAEGKRCSILLKDLDRLLQLVGACFAYSLVRPPTDVISSENKEITRPNS